MRPGGARGTSACRCPTSFARIGGAVAGKTLICVHISLGFTRRRGGGSLGGALTLFGIVCGCYSAKTTGY